MTLRSIGFMLEWASGIGPPANVKMAAKMAKEQLYSSEAIIKGGA
jgi:hypothetical protein